MLFTHGIIQIIPIYLEFFNSRRTFHNSIIYSGFSFPLAETKYSWTIFQKKARLKSDLFSELTPKVFLLDSDAVDMRSSTGTAVEVCMWRWIKRNPRYFMLFVAEMFWKNSDFLTQCCCFVFNPTSLTLSSPLAPTNMMHYQRCREVSVWYNCFVSIRRPTVRFRLIMTLPCSVVCLLCPDASREIQSTFTPKITFCVPLSLSASSREREGLPVTLGGVTQMVRQMCGRSTWWESAAGVKRATDCFPCLGANDKCVCAFVCVRVQPAGA